MENMEKMENLLELKNVTFSFRTYGGVVQSVRDVSFNIKPGEIVGIVGESGCGKSVTSQCILKLNPEPPGFFGPDSSIKYNGEEIVTMSDKEMRKIRGKEIGFIFQDPMTSLNPTMKVGAQIEEIFVGRGPGSYTGVRVACTVAKVLAYIKNKKLYSFSSLDLLLTTNLSFGKVVCQMDARRGFSYAKAFNISENIEVIKEEEFTETTKLQDEFADALFITNESYNYNPVILIEKGLFREENNIHGFVPTYLRSGV